MEKDISSFWTEAKENIKDEFEITEGQNWNDIFIKNVLRKITNVVKERYENEENVKAVLSKSLIEPINVDKELFIFSVDTFKNKFTREKGIHSYSPTADVVAIFLGYSSYKGWLNGEAPEKFEEALEQTPPATITIFEKKNLLWKLFFLLVMIVLSIFIYKSNSQSKVRIVHEITVIDADTKEEIPGAQILLAELLTADEEIDTTNAYGKTAFMIDQEIEYRIRASKKLIGNEVYLAVSEDFKIDNIGSTANFYTTIELHKVLKNTEIKIDNIYYDEGMYFIREDVKPELDKLIKILDDNPGMEIEISSHTDCRGSRKSNAQLSAQRAESVVNYLIANGVSYKRLAAIGYGESMILNGCECEGAVKSNCTKSQHQANRRTVFSILKFD